MWWCSYSVNGRKERESTKCQRHADAVKFLRRRLAEVGLNRPRPRDVERVTLADLYEQVRLDYKRNNRRSIARLEDAFNHLSTVFTGRAIEITSAAIARYQSDRLDAGYAPSTVNWETACLRRAFRICRDLGMLTDVPVFNQLKVDNARTGFVEEGDFRAFKTHLPACHQGWAEFSYITGWRVASEVLTRQWRHVDLDHGWVELEKYETKNDEARRFPLIPRLRAVIDRQLECKRVIEATGKIVRYVFTYDDGRKNKAPSRAWKSACKATGLDITPHDFRRSAVRNLERAGVPRSTAMELVGHKTESIYLRYAIQDEGMLRQGREAVRVLCNRARREERGQCTLTVKVWSKSQPRNGATARLPAQVHCIRNSLSRGGQQGKV